MSIRMGRRTRDNRIKVTENKEYCDKIKSAMDVSPNFSLCVLEALRVLEMNDGGCESRSHGWQINTLVSSLKSANERAHLYGDLVAQVRAALQRELEAGTVRRTCVGWRLAKRGRYLSTMRAERKSTGEEEKKSTTKDANKMDCRLCGNCGRVLSKSHRPKVPKCRKRGAKNKWCS